jgi:hypothetical protein
MNEEFAQRFKRARLGMLPGGHATERQYPYLIARAMHWLARVVGQQVQRSSG